MRGSNSWYRKLLNLHTCVSATVKLKCVLQCERGQRSTFAHSIFRRQPSKAGFHVRAWNPSGSTTAEVASAEAIFGRKPSRSSYMTRGVLYGIHFLAVIVWLLKLSSLRISTRQGTNVGRTSGRVASLERQPVSSRARSIHARIFTRSGANSLRAHSALVLREQTRTAATRFVWTAVILNSSKTNGPFSNDRELKMQLNGVYEIFWTPKGGFNRTPSNTPLPMGLGSAWCPSLPSTLFNKSVLP